uniref:testis-specific gene A8 protein-like n=1 Tax=Doryrhamphus excisus TaxID=161450 RepID=UPI0025AE80AC|nr:testis-specific gene A8 protein-like [Doryrhamphus excisus]
MGCSTSSQTSTVDSTRPGAKPEESNGTSTTGAANGNIAEDSETLPDQTPADASDVKAEGEDTAVETIVSEAPAAPSAASAPASPAAAPAAAPAAQEELQLTDAEAPPADVPEAASPSEPADADPPASRVEAADPPQPAEEAPAASD